MSSGRLITHLPSILPDGSGLEVKTGILGCTTAQALPNKVSTLLRIFRPRVKKLLMAGPYQANQNLKRVSLALQAASIQQFRLAQSFLAPLLLQTHRVSTLEHTQALEQELIPLLFQEH